MEGNRKCKKCGRPLPDGYKFDCCENCRNKKVDIVKKIGGFFGGVLAIIGPLAIGLITHGKKAD